MSFIISSYKKQLVHRYDDDLIIKYFRPSDFEGLKYDKYEFKSDENTLRGCFYYYENYNKDNLVIFCHGIGGGYLSYMVEIEKLCKNGYRVFAYDNTGCFCSEGQSIKCLSQSLKDLDNAIKSLKKDNIFQCFKNVFIIGHSCGGYAAGNILNYHNDISKVVVISGFITVKHFLECNIKGFAKIGLRTILNFEKKTNPDYFFSSSIDAFNKTSAKVLIVHSEDDPMVDYANSIDVLKEKVDNPKVEFLIYKNKKHNPNYSLDAVNYMNEVLGSYNTKIKKKELNSFEEKKAFLKDTDWKRMTSQDENFWIRVLDFLR